MNLDYDNFIVEFFKFAGLIIGSWVTWNIKSKKQKSDETFKIIEELRKENTNKTESIKSLEEKVDGLVGNFEDLRKKLYETQEEKHKEEMRNLNLTRENTILQDEKAQLVNDLEIVTKEKEKIEKEFNDKIANISNRIEDLNKQNDKLVEKNNDLNKRIDNLTKKQ